MDKQLLMRLNLLLEVGEIDEEIKNTVIDFVNNIEDDHSIEISEENGSMLVSHLAMALARIKRGEEIEAIDEEIFKEVKETAIYKEMPKYYSQMEKALNIEIPQVEKQNIANLIKEIGKDKVEVTVKTDIQAANDVKLGKADYYVGACHTGGGGALSMAIALLTREKTATLSMPGRPPKEEDIIKAVEEGKVAFGFTGDHYEQVIPILMRELLAKNE